MNMPLSLPASIEAKVTGMTFTPITAGLSGAGVWRVSDEQGQGYFLKISVDETKAEGRAEYEKLAWVSAHFPAPRIVHVGETDDALYLLTEALRGVTLDEALGQAEDTTVVVQNVGTALRQLHALSTDGCPFDMHLTHRLILAAERVRDGHVDADDFDENRAGMEAADVLAEAIGTRPHREDPVFTHGDFTPANVLVNPTTLEITGLIDWGRAGIADRHQDVGLMLRDLDPELHRAFLDAYGHPVERALVEYYQLMDEFF